jgi:hypothetical protein
MAKSTATRAGNEHTQDILDGTPDASRGASGDVHLPEVMFIPMNWRSRH